MNQFTKLTVLTLICGIIALSGCRNQCGPYMPTNPFTASSRIAAPPTYSVRLPNGTGQPYYGNAANPPLGSGLTAPLPNNQPLGNPGWQNMGSGGMNPTSFSVPQNQSPGFVPGFSVVGSTLPNVNSSLVSNQYSSIPYNQRLDSTRVPMTDATRVTAPTMLPAQQAYGGLAQAVYQGPTAQPYIGRTMPNSRTEFYGQVRAATPYAGYVVQAQPNLNQGVPISPQNLQNNPNIQNGWTASQTASQMQPNRQ